MVKVQTATGTTRLRRSDHISFFRKKDEIYGYHDLWGFILQMDRKVHEFVEAFGRGAGRPVAEVAREFRRKLRPEEIEGFVGTFRQHRCLVAPRADEREDSFVTGYPSKAPWVVSWSPRPDEVVLAYKDRGLRRVVIERLDRMGARFFNLADGEHSAAEIAGRLAADYPGQEGRGELRRLLFRLTHSDRQVLKLTDRPLYEYLAFPPPYLRSTMPYPRLEEADAAAAAAGGSDPGEPDVVDLAQFHRAQIEDAAAQFDVEETTLSHMFRDAHDALGGKSYGEAFAEALGSRGLLPDHGGAIEVVEVGGGVGFFALRFLRALADGDRARFERLRYAILDLSQVLQDSQRMLNFELGGKVRYVLTNVSRALPFRDASIDLVLSNEVIADLETVRLRRADLAAPPPAKSDPSVPAAIREAHALVRRHALPVEDAAEVFWLNLGALRLVEELHRVLRPGGAAVLVEFGGESRYPVESTHLAHSEFSIHFGHLRHVAANLGLEVELTGIMELLGMRGDVRVLATTRSFFECLRALLDRRGISLQKIAYTPEMFKALCSDRLDPASLNGLTFRPTRDRALGLHPPEFMVAIIRKPQAQTGAR